MHPAKYWPDTYHLAGKITLCHVTFLLLLCENQFQLLCALKHLLFLGRNQNNLLMKVGITVAENQRPLTERKHQQLWYPFEARNFCCISTRLPKENIWQKTMESAKSCLKVSILYTALFQFPWSRKVVKFNSSSFTARNRGSQYTF